MNKNLLQLLDQTVHGKSTLAKIIMGIEKPNSGKIFFNGKDITKLTIDERANLGLGFAFQQPVKFKGLTVKDLISLAANEDINLTEACQYLSDVGLCARDYIGREVDRKSFWRRIKKNRNSNSSC